MAGAGVKLFTAGSQLTATEVNTYLMDQVVAYFADSAARNAAFGGAGEPNLSAGRLAYLFSDNKLYLYDNTNNWVEIGAQIEDGEITTAKIAALAVTAAKIASDAVTTAKILDANVTDAKIASDAVTTAKILDANVTAAKLASDSVTTVKILDSNVTTAKIADGAITQAKLATGTPQAGFRSVQNAATITSSNYTIQLTDLGKLVEIDNATACTLTVPTNASVAFSVGDRIDVLQIGAGQVTITPVSGTVTINGYDGGLLLNGQWAAATLIKRATNTWVAVGNLTT